MTKNLKDEWKQHCLKVSNDLELIEKLWLEIKKQYSLKIRHYHNLMHLENMLTHAYSIQDEIKNWQAFLFSIWYHDIVYKPTRKDNEVKSAVLAKIRLKQLNIDEKTSKIIQKLIISTKNHKINLTENNDNAFLLDIDLSILGSDWNTYKNYIQNIRKEYSIYPSFMYRKGRKKVLYHFLERESLYFTEIFQNKYEEQARKNLVKEIELL
ncbi:hypothetical protein EYD45_12100 [Hyunsoonleella flava]|uniref:Metal-dependent HD superfamily phosphohydrolase n=1 Tax=Hyunsoonleella flava TaxID=2527939 RepID=A0A4Q9FC60_9FLAO|nr:hypothetical protein [Hyunsoonleella flava]TBN02443.1 hypothetical protein EYD45_12100 [Hyunsoonleella flava]